MSNRNFGILCSAALLVLYVFPVFAANTVPPNAAEKKAISDTSGKSVEATGTSDNAVLEETQGHDPVGHSVASKLGNRVVVVDATAEPPELEPKPADSAGEPSTLWLPLMSMIIALGSGLLGTALVGFRIGKRVARAEKKATMAESKVERLWGQIESLRATANTAAERSEEALRRSTSAPRLVSPASTDSHSTFAHGPETQPQTAAPQPHQRESRLPLVARGLVDSLTRLLSSPGFRMGDYDAAIAQFGSIYGVQVSPAGQAQLVRLEDDSSRRLVAVVLDDEDVAVIVPSSRYAKDFSMTYKESLEAGADVKALFEFKIDGTAALKIAGVCSGRVEAGTGLHHIQRGELAGFVR
jgi:hypothetical protein